MNCYESQKLIDKIEDNKLSVEEDNLLREHCKSCIRCNCEVEALKEIMLDNEKLYILNDEIKFKQKIMNTVKNSAPTAIALTKFERYMCVSVNFISLVIGSVMASIVFKGNILSITKQFDKASKIINTINYIEKIITKTIAFLMKTILKFETNISFYKVFLIILLVILLIFYNLPKKDDFLKRRIHGKDKEKR